jgi:hypothetical protein
MDDRINAIHIALIPKKSNPCRVSDFLPIGLCNVMYKLISKALANRLKEVLPHVISSTNVPSLHTMHTRIWSKVGFMGIKLDISKAYD